MRKPPMSDERAKAKMIKMTIFIAWLMVIIWSLCQVVLATISTSDVEVLVIQGCIAVLLVSIGAGWEIRCYQVYRQRIERRHQWEDHSSGWGAP